MRGPEARELDKAELAEIYRRLAPGKMYFGDEPEERARNILLREIRVQMVRLRRETAGRAC